MNEGESEDEEEGKVLVGENGNEKINATLLVKPAEDMTDRTR